MLMGLDKTHNQSFLHGGQAAAQDSRTAQANPSQQVRHVYEGCAHGHPIQDDDLPTRSVRSIGPNDTHLIGQCSFVK